MALKDADLSYSGRINLGIDPAELLGELVSDTPWRQDTVTLWGKTHPQPRLTAWYGDRECAYRYSGIRLEPFVWTSRLSDLRDRAEQIAGVRFNSVLLNYYRDQRDSMGMHCDDEPELGAQPVIASISLGAERALVFKHKHAPELKPATVVLESGSLLLMRGDTQANWKHGIMKTKRKIGPRVNLTFRKIVT